MIAEDEKNDDTAKDGIRDNIQNWLFLEKGI